MQWLSNWHILMGTWAALYHLSPVHRTCMPSRGKIHTWYSVQGCTVARSTSIPKAGPVLFIICYGQDHGQIITSFFGCCHCGVSTGVGCSQQLPCELIGHGKGRQSSSLQLTCHISCLSPHTAGGWKKKKNLIFKIFFLNEQMHKAAKGNQVKNQKHLAPSRICHCEWGLNQTTKNLCAGTTTFHLLCFGKAIQDRST